MQKFKTFLESYETHNYIPYAPVHGAHAHQDVKKHYRSIEESDMFPTIPRISDFDHQYHNDKIAPSESHLERKLAGDYSFLDTHPSTPELRKYTSSSALLNLHLLKAQQTGQPHDPLFTTPSGEEHDVGKLDDLLASGSLSHLMHVYSGISFNPSVLAKKHPLGIFESAPYTSASITPKIASWYAGGENTNGVGQPIATNIMHIRLPVGQRGVYVGDHSMHPAENEFLLPRQQKFKLMQNKPDRYYDPFGKSLVNVWHTQALLG
jgi:hypothetical protein